MKPEYLQDELRAEVALILCEKPEDQIIELWRLEKLKFYTVRIIINLIQSNSSPFYKKFRGSYSPDIGYIERLLNKYEDSPPDDAVEQFQVFKTYSESLKCHDNYDDSKDRAIAEIDNLYWYDREILKLYAEHGTYRKVEEVTGIPFESIYKTVQRGCKQIRLKVA